MFAEDCQARLSEIYQQPMTLQPEFLQSISKQQFLVRMLSNLKLIYLQREELEKALAAVERILLLLPNFPTELRDRGLIYYQLGRWVSAGDDFEQYLAKVPDAQDAPVIRRLLAQLGRIWMMNYE